MPIFAWPASPTAPTTSLIAYAVDTKGSEFYTVNVIEAGTGTLVDSRIVDSNGSLEWSADSRTLFYVWLDDEHRPRRVLRHAVGAESADAIVHEQDDPSYFLGLGRDAGPPIPRAQRA